LSLIWSFIEFAEGKFGRGSARAELWNVCSPTRAEGESATWHEWSEATSWVFQLPKTLLNTSLLKMVSRKHCLRA